MTSSFMVVDSHETKLKGLFFQSHFENINIGMLSAITSFQEKGPTIIRVFLVVESFFI